MSRGSGSFAAPVFVLLLIVVGAGGFLAYRVASNYQRVRPTADMTAVLHANNLGVGHMEQFKFDEAVKAFEEVQQLAPDWLPGRINLAIALFNTQKPDKIARAEETFTRILEEDHDNPYAHFCLGIILKDRGPDSFASAARHFEAVTKVDPSDAASWYWLGTLSHDDQDQALKYFRKAHELGPNMLGPVYALFQRERDPKRQKVLGEVFKSFERLEATERNAINYSEMGHYADVIGRPPNAVAPPTGPLPLFRPDEKFQVKLAADTRWAKAADFKGSPQAELRARARARFGAVIVVLDYNRDDRPDLFCVGAVVQGEQVRDLLLRNDGGGRFTDVTAAAGLDKPRPSLGCCVADFDNDGLPDLFISGVGEQHLFRNSKAGRFEDVTAKAGLDQLKTICLGAAFVDLDLDGDLDLVIAQYTTADQVAAALQPKGPPAGAGLAVYLNVGEAPPAKQPLPKDPPPLEPKFRKADKPPELLGKPESAVNVVATDLDQDNDPDLLILADRASADAVLNDRLLRFRRQTLPQSLLPQGTWNGACVLDVNHDGLFDLCLVGPGQRPVVLLKQRRDANADIGKRFEPSATNSPPLLQAEAIDLDLDGYTDVVGLSEQRKPVLLHNDGRRLAHALEALGRDADWPNDLLATVVTDYNDDGSPDLLVWSEESGLKAYASQGNGNHGLKVIPVGHRYVKDGHQLRSNADGIGTVVTAQVDSLATALENATLQAGLGQSRQPLILGLGNKRQADIVRLRWPDNVLQAEFGPTSGVVARIYETNRKGTSCPLLFAWDGRRFGFVTDFLGAGALGESQADGSQRMPRPEESVKIEPDQLRPLDGQLILKFAEPMDEITYLDRLQLVAVDHPDGVRVYPDERLATAAPAASQALFALGQEIGPQRAVDHRGRDITQTLRRWDRDTGDGFAKRTWLGFAEEHWVELDFGDRLAHFGPKDRLILCLAGWTDYAYPESIWAASQAGVAMQAPVLERKQADGRWQPVAEIGFPAGLPRMMTYEVTGNLGGPRCVLRLRTNLHVYWDQVFVAPLLEVVDPAAKQPGTVRATCLEVGAADLAPRGCVQEFSPDGRLPTIYDYDRLESVPVTRLSGRVTRFGDVTELLRAADDRFVIFGPGDEVMVRFDARRLPELPAGWKRSFVLRTWGYCKDTGPFTATGDTVEPLPFRGMSKYPYGPDEHYPRDAVHQDYLRRYNTRQIGPKK